MDIVIIAATSIAAIGAACAALLSIASKVMAVKIDERVEKIIDALPGSNCGACGFPGCAGYAEALIADPDTKINMCPPGGAALVKAIGEILGVEGGAAVSKVAIIHCGGRPDLRAKKMEYHGIQSCAAANGLFGGENACTYGCLGYGDCEAVCPSGAICMDSGLPRVNLQLCTGCILCAKACPTKIITMKSSPVRTIIKCNNNEKGAIARKKCEKSCIACTKCMKECPNGAIVMQDNLAKIDYAKCKDCGHCTEICVNKCIETFELVSKPA